MRTLDCKGLDCPEPVVRTKNELSAMPPGDTLTVIVDNAAAAQNVMRLARSLSCAAQKTQVGSDHAITITKGYNTDAVTKPVSTGADTILFVKSATIGTGDDELGRVLVNGFCNTLADYDAPPKRIFFVNGGVTLTVKRSDVLPALQKLQEKGVEIFSCGTCLDYYGLKDDLAVGKVGNMYELVDNLFSHNVVYI